MRTRARAPELKAEMVVEVRSLLLLVPRPFEVMTGGDQILRFKKQEGFSLGVKGFALARAWGQ